MQVPDRLGVVHGVLVFFALALVGKAGYEQLYRGNYWAQQGRGQHYAISKLPAPRGEILDESGDTLVESRELTQIAIAPPEVKDLAVLGRALRAAHVDPKWIGMATDRRRKWVEIPTKFLPEDIAPVVAIRGVHPTPVMDRVYANSAGIRRIVGRVDPQTGKPLDGVELTLDLSLRGDTGSVRVARDKSGQKMDAPGGNQELRAGNAVELTINHGLQDICEQAITHAVDSMHASGGDIVVLNPNTGDILAMASYRVDPRAMTANTAITEPYEPGSTLKPFMAAALLSRGLAKADEVIQTYNGQFELDGRVITDEHKAPELSLAEVIKYSSNIGIVRFTQRLTPREKYETLRDAGFGTPTTVQLPAESPGILREPVQWSKQSAASVVMGYEISVTPLQLATAYSAIANGGELLEPHLIKEIQAPDGTVKYQAKRRVLRRIMPPAVAAQIRQMLQGVVEGGTGQHAELTTIDISGKTGTARRTVHGKYAEGAYTASFVGLFPSDRPQYVVLAKLDNPENGYFGGPVAGGVTNVVLRAALAARDAALDLHELASSVHAPKIDSADLLARKAEHEMAAADTPRHSVGAVVSGAAESSVVSNATVAPPVAAPPPVDPRTNASYVVKLPSVKQIAPLASTMRPVPNVTGLSLRAAVVALHAAGFRVELAGGHGVIQTAPAAGTAWMPGRVVKVSGGTW